MENFNRKQFMDNLRKDIAEMEKLVLETRIIAIEAKNIALETKNYAITSKEESKQALLRIEQLHQCLIGEGQKSFWQRLFSQK